MKEMATHSSTLAWKIPWTEEHSGLQSMGVAKSWTPLSYFTFTSYKENSVSRVQLFVTPWTVADQAPPSMGFSRQEYWSGLPFPSPGDLPDPGIEA